MATPAAKPMSGETRRAWQSKCTAEEEEVKKGDYCCLSWHGADVHGAASFGLIRQKKPAHPFPLAEQSCIIRENHPCL